MATINYYGLSGVANDVQLGKQGPHIVAISNNIQVLSADKTQLVNLQVANAVELSDAVNYGFLIDILNNTFFNSYSGSDSNTTDAYYANTAGEADTAVYANTAEVANTALSGWPVYSVNGLVGNVVLSSDDIANVVNTVTLAITLGSYATQSFITSQGYLTSVTYPVTSVNGQLGNVIITSVANATYANNAGSSAFSSNSGFANTAAVALSGWTYPVTSVAGHTGNVVLSVTDIANAVSNVALQATLGSYVTTASLTTSLGSYVPESAVGAANGVAPLNSFSQLPSQYLPSSISGALVYQGTWDAFLNSPYLANGTGTVGLFYRVANAGTNLGYTWNVGDDAIYDGSYWDKIDGLPSEVASVNGMTGAVVLSVSNISGAVSNTTLASYSYATQTFVTSQGYLTNVTSVLYSNYANFAGSALVASTANVALSGWSYPVTSVNGLTGNVVLNVSNIAGAVSNTTLANYSYATQTFVASQGYLTNATVTYPVTAVNGLTGNVVLNVTNITNAVSNSTLNSTLANYLPLSGGSLSGNITFSSVGAQIGGSISNLSNGTAYGIDFDGTDVIFCLSNVPKTPQIIFAYGTNVLLQMSPGSVSTSIPISTSAFIVANSLGAYNPVTNGQWATQGAYIGWNYSNSTNETDFINSKGALGNSGGFNFYNVTSSSLNTPNLIASIGGTGTFTAAAGNFAGTVVASSLSANAITTITQATNNNSNYVATTAFVQNVISNAIPAGVAFTSSVLACSGTAGTASAVVLGSGLTIAGNNLYFGTLGGAQWQTPGAYIAYNYTNVTGETDFFCSKGTYAGGFNFYNVISNTSSTPVLLASISNTGLFTANAISSGTMYAATQAAGNNSTYVATTAFVQSTVGSYLPLSGGSMTGGLIGTTGSFSGSIQASSGTFAGALVSGSLSTGSITASGLITGGIVAATGMITSAQWANQGAYRGWNYSSGGGESDFLNSKGGGSGGFNFYNVASNSSATPSLIASISGTGTFTANSGTFTTSVVSATASFTTSVVSALGSFTALQASSGTFTGALTTGSISSGTILASSILTAGVVAAGNVLTSTQWANQNAYLGWNYAGSGEMDLWTSHGLAGGGFNFYNVASSGTATPSLIASIGGTGFITASGGSFTGAVTSTSVSTGTITASSYSGGTLTGIVYAPTSSNLAFQLAASSSSFYVQSSGGGNNLLIVGTSQISAGVPISAGTVYTTTQSAGNNSTYVATTAFVQTALTNAIPAGNSITLLGCSGTSGTASVISLSSGLSIFSNVLAFGGVTSLQWYNQGAYISWNYSGSGGETDFINSRGGGSGGYNFYNVNSSNYSATPNLIASIGGTGVVTANGVSLNASRFTPVSGGTVTLTTGVTSALIQGAGSLMSLTVALPGTPTVSAGCSQELTIYFVNAVMTLAWTGTGSVVGAALPTGAAAGTAVKLAYFQAIGDWVHYTNI